jgi:hypothetical protein
MGWVWQGIGVGVAGNVGVRIGVDENKVPVTVSALV